MPPASFESRASPVRAWTTVGILWLFYVISFMDRGVISLMVEPIMKDLAISKVQMGVLQGFAFATTYSLAALPLGWAVDRYRRRTLLYAGVLTWSLGTLGCGLAHTYAQMAGARAVVGIGEAVLTPTALSLIADLFPRDRIAAATAFFSSGATMGVGAALIVGGALLNTLQQHGGLTGIQPWQGVFLIFAILGVLSAGLCFLVIDARPEPHSTTTAQAASLADFGRFLLARLPLLLSLFLSFPLLLAVSNAYLAWTPHHFQSAFGWDAHRVGLVLGSMNVVAPVLGVITGGFAMDRALRRGVRAPHIVIPLISTLLGVPLLASGLLASNSQTAIVLLAIGLFIFNAFASAQGTLVQLLAPPDLRGRFAAVYMLIVSLVGLGLGALLPPLINSAQAVSHQDVGWATAVSIVCIGGVAFVALLLGRGRLHVALTESGHTQSRINTKS